MDLGALEVQIFVSLAVVLGAIFVALLTDFLKGNNEALRERNIELVVRQDERERYDTRAGAASVAVPVAPAAAPAPSTPDLPPVTAAHAPAVAPIVQTEGSDVVVEPPSEEWATDGELSAIDALAERIRASAAPPAEPELSVPPEKVEEAPEPPVPADAELTAEEPAPAEEPSVQEDPVAETPAEEPQETVEKEVAEEPAAVEEPTAVEEPPAVEEPVEAEGPVAADAQPADGPVEEPPATEEEVRQQEELPKFTIHTKVTPIDVVATEQAVESEAIKLARELERVADLTSDEPPEPGDLYKPEESLDEATTSPEITEPDSETIQAATDFEPEDSGETGSPEEPAEAASGSRTVMMPEPAVAPEAEIRRHVPVPTGYQDFSALAEAIESDALFRGTVVSISVATSDGEEDPESTRSVAEFVESLLTPADFACQSREDEFLVILPEEIGSQAQRRLQYISQRLWDYQIRAVGSRSLMFSWGAAEIAGEPLLTAIGAAKDRMLQTKRTRERASSEIHHYHMRAAND